MITPDEPRRTKPNHIATGFEPIDNVADGLSIDGATMFGAQTATSFGLQFVSEFNEFATQFGGAGFGAYSGLLSTTGTITSLADYDLSAGTNLVNTWTGFSFLASDLVTWVGANDAAAFTNAIWGGADTLNGTGFGDKLYGYGGADLLLGLGGADELNGGDGIDTSSYAAAAARVRVNLATGAGLDSDAQGDTLTAIENLVGSNFNDVLTGGAGANRLTGGGGADTLNGGPGADIMIGGNGNDIYSVNVAGDLTTESSAGGGSDLVNSSVTRTLGGNLEKLTLTGSAVINGTGNTLANIINGNSVANTLSGLAGADTLIGGAGGDRLIGGAGLDILTGGIGADKFVFNSAPAAANRDTISDYNVAADTIQIASAAFVGIGALGALAAGKFHVGASAADSSDRIIYNSATGAFFFDADGNGAGAQIQFATLSAGLGLTAADVVVI